MADDLQSPLLGAPRRARRAMAWSLAAALATQSVAGCSDTARKDAASDDDGETKKKKKKKKKSKNAKKDDDGEGGVKALTTFLEEFGKSSSDALAKHRGKTIELSGWVRDVNDFDDSEMVFITDVKGDRSRPYVVCTTPPDANLPTKEAMVTIQGTVKTYHAPMEGSVPIPYRIGLEPCSGSWSKGKPAPKPASKPTHRGCAPGDPLCSDI